MPSFNCLKSNTLKKPCLESFTLTTCCRQLLHFKWINRLHHLIFLCQLLGVAPVNIDAEHNKQRHKGRARCHITSGAHIVYSTIMLCIMSACSYAQYKCFVYTLTPIRRFLVCVEYVFNVLNCTIIIVGANMQRSRYLEFERMVESIERRLRRRQQQLKSDCGVSRYLRWFYFACVLLLILLYVVTVQFNDTSWGVLFGSATHVLPNMMVMLAMGKYYGCMIIMRQRFQWLIEGLQELDVIDKYNIVSVDVRSGDEHNHKRVAKNMFIFEFNAVASATSSCPSAGHFERLNELRDIYHDLCHLSGALNRSFGLLLIGVLTAAIFIITGQLYSMYHYWSNGEFPVLMYFHFVVWTCKQFATVTIALAVNTRLDEEVRFGIHFCNTIGF